MFPHTLIDEGLVFLRMFKHVSQKEKDALRFITLFKSITMLCGTDHVLQNVPHIQTEYGEYNSVPRNNVMDLNNVMLIVHDSLTFLM